MSANTFSYRVLVKSFNEKGEPVFSISEKVLALPMGGTVTDSEKLAEALKTALESVYHDELASAECKASEALRKVLAKAESGKASAEDVLKAKVKYHEASAKYASYPSVPVCSDPIAKFLAYAITATRLVKINEATTMLALLRTPSATIDKTRPVITEYFNDRFNLRAEGCEYLKPYRCKLTDAQIENLRKVAQVEILKWTDKGIEGRYINDMKLWQQVVLTILADAFKLKVVKEEKTAYDTI